MGADGSLGLRLPWYENYQVSRGENTNFPKNFTAGFTHTVNLSVYKDTSGREKGDIFSVILSGFEETTVLSGSGYHIFHGS
jgi:hypothetical protein